MYEVNFDLMSLSALNLNYLGLDGDIVFFVWMVLFVLLRFWQVDVFDWFFKIVIDSYMSLKMLF